MKLHYLALIASALFICQDGVAQKRQTKAPNYIDYNKNGVMDVYEDASRSTEERVVDLLSQMNVEEKTCQLATIYGFGRVLQDSLPTPEWKNEIWKDGIANIDEQLNGVGSGYKRAYDLIYPFSNHVEAINTIQRWFIEETRLGIPVDFTNESLHGLNHTKATPLPSPINIGSTWNKSLVKEAGEIAGKEAKALGYTNIYAPILDVARDQRWGRIVECYGEDPYLIAELGIEMVQGIQSQGVGSTLKHYAVYGIPKGGRDGHVRTDPHVAPREMHQMHLYPFRRVVQEANPVGVMASYNDWDGVPIIASKYFMTDLLRGAYNFDGYIVSDSEAVEFVYTKHEVAPDYDDAVRQVLEAGMNVRTNFTPAEVFILAARRLIEDNKISMETIDKRVAEVLRTKFRLGIFDNPYVENPKAADKIVGIDKHEEFVDQMMSESIVLLKNDNLLPLDKKAVSKVLVTGPLATENNFMISRYGPNGLKTTNVLQGVEEYLKKDAKVVYSKGCDIIDAQWPDSELYPVAMNADEQKMLQEAVDAAQDCDVIFAVLGEDEHRVGESRSRTSLELPGHQQKLLEALQATGKPVVLILINGRPLTINWANENVAAILETWFPSCVGGRIIAETIFGDNNPSGKLTVTFPRSIGQIEYNFPFKKGSHAGQPDEGGNGTGSTRVLGALYPFGYGLSYTSFEYTDLKIDAPAKGTKGEVKVSLNVKNTGKYYGGDIVQLYVADKVSSVVAYESELRGFEKVFLEPGESTTLNFTLTASDLEILDANMNLTVEPGDFDVMIGSSSEDIKLKGTFTLTE